MDYRGCQMRAGLTQSKVRYLVLLFFSNKPTYVRTFHF
jgi:hypothetical protein